METLRHLDYSIFHFINQTLACDFLDFLCPILREKFVWTPVYMLIAWYFFKTFGTKTWWLLIIAIVTILLSDQLSSAVIKPIFHRLRPCNNPSLPYDVRLVIHDCGVGFSFVSSHAANHFAIAAYISFILQRSRVSAILFLWASVVALSQVYVGVHFPADIAGGAVLGCLIGYINAKLALRFVLWKQYLRS